MVERYAYANDNLMPGEKIIAQARLTTFYVWVWAVISGVCSFPLLRALFASADQQTAAWDLLPFLLCIPLCPLLITLYEEWGRRTRELVLTERRLILKIGRVSVNVKDIPVEKIQAVHYTQSVAQRIFGFGSVMIQSAGTTAHENLTGVINPKEFRNAILSQMEQMRRTRVVGL